MERLSNTLSADKHPQPSVQLIAIHLLSTRLSARLPELSEPRVEALMAAVDQLPPVLVHRATMTVIDGAHRLEAFRRAGRSLIPVRTFDGEWLEAVALAVRAKAAHGQLTLADRRQAASVMISVHAKGSDHVIDAICDVARWSATEERYVTARHPARDNESFDRDARELDRFVRWLSAASVGEGDWALLVGAIPVSRAYDVADECRRRAAGWGALADAMDQKGRAGSLVPDPL
jgi:hypothetical protein